MIKSLKNIKFPIVIIGSKIIRMDNISKKINLQNFNEQKSHHKKKIYIIDILLSLKI